MNLLRPLVPALLAVLASAAEPAASAPTAAQWTPIAAVLGRNDAAAEPLLRDLAARFPGWPDASRELALLHLRAGRGDAAVAAARAARAIAPTDGDLLILELRALAAAGQLEEAYGLVTRSAGRDPRGQLRLEAGLVAAAAGDAAKAMTFLSEAKLRVGPQVPPEALLLEARIAVLNGDLARAEVALASAVGQRDDHLMAWRELGRVRLARAEAAPSEALAHLAGADQAFSKAASDVRDLGARVGLGQARLGIANLQKRAGDAARGDTTLASAVKPLEEALLLDPSLAIGHALLGRLTLLQGHYASAVVHLRRAQELDPRLPRVAIDLATALARQGHHTEAEALLATITFASAAERFQAGLDAYDTGNDLLAVRWLGTAASELPGRNLQAAAWRYAGHAAQRLAGTGSDREARLDEAATCYRAAATLGDAEARAHLLAQEAARSPAHAQAVGWYLIGADGGASVEGWRLVLGHAGLVATRGEGLAGAHHSPLGLLAWLALGLAPLGAGIALLWPRRQPQPLIPKVTPTTPTTPRPAPAGLRPTVKPRRVPSAIMQLPPSPSAPAEGETTAGATMMPAPYQAPNDGDALERR